MEGEDNMSYSSVWLVDEDGYGQEGAVFQNAYLFPMEVWDVLAKKYIPDKVMEPDGKRVPMMSGTGIRLMPVLNERMNESEDLADRICWELTMQQVFSVKDRKQVADAIRQFEKRYPEIENKDRFREIANFIEGIREEYSFFIFKNTSCDDAVERLFVNDDGKISLNAAVDAEEVEFVRIHGESLDFSTRP